MKLPAVVTSLYIYHGCSTRKTFWEGKSRIGEFTIVNMKNCGHCNVRKHRDIKDSDNYTTLDILSKFESMEKMRITYSEPK